MRELSGGRVDTSHKSRVHARSVLHCDNSHQTLMLSFVDLSNVQGNCVNSSDVFVFNRTVFLQNRRKNGVHKVFPISEQFERFGTRDVSKEARKVIM